MSASDALQLRADRAGELQRLQVLRSLVVDGQWDEPRPSATGAADGPLAVRIFHGGYCPTAPGVDVNSAGAQTGPPARAMTTPITPAMTSALTTPRRITKSQISALASTGICHPA
jgi:hypothetical protein